jgi:hypothetical protein
MHALIAFARFWSAALMSLFSRSRSRADSRGSPPQPEPTRHTLALAHDYTINGKAVLLAVLLEGGLSGGIFYGAWENAELYAASHPVFMLIAPYLSVIVEFTKVPLGLISQTHPSTIKRVLAVVGLLAAGVGTAINAVPIVAKLWKPQLAAVQQATTNLAIAEADQGSFANSREAAKEAAEKAKAVYAETQAARGALSSDLTKLPPLRCQRETTKQRARCFEDPRTEEMKTGLSVATRAAAAAEEKMDAANKALATFDSKKTDDMVRDANAALAKARQNSTLHWIYAAATGAEISTLSDAKLAPLMIAAIGLPSLVIALSSSLLSVLAVSRILRPKPATKPEPTSKPVIETPVVAQPCETYGVRGREFAASAPDLAPREPPAPMTAQKRDNQPYSEPLHKWDAIDLPSDWWERQNIMASYAHDWELGLTDAAVTDQFAGATVVAEPEPAPPRNGAKAKAPKASPSKRTPAPRRKEMAPARAKPAPASPAVPPSDNTATIIPFTPKGTDK